MHTEIDAIRRMVAAGSSVKANEFDTACAGMRVALQDYGGEMLLKAVAVALLEVQESGHTANIIGRVINQLADVEW
jgi:hypothetical protein